MVKNTVLQKSYFNQCTDIGSVFLGIYRNVSKSNNLHQIFNKNFNLINEICDDDNTLPMSKRDLDIKKFTPLKLG